MTLDTSHAVDTAERWHDLAAGVAELPGVVDRLLQRHHPDGGGLCVACTEGGTGVPSAPWPCSLHQLATAAGRIRNGRQGRACT